IDATEIYRISLRSNDKSLIWEKLTTASELSYPKDEMPLEYGTRYEWEIEAINNGEAIADKSSCFSLPGKSEIDGIRKQLEIYNGQLSIDSKNSVNKLSLIIFIKQNMLYDDALGQYQELQKVHGKSLSIDEAEQRIIKIRKASCKPLT